MNTGNLNKKKGKKVLLGVEEEKFWDFDSKKKKKK